MFFSDIKWFEQLESTNSYLADLARKNPDIHNGTVIAARHQTRGRGRKDHTWTSEPGKNLTFSILLKTKAKPETLPTVTLVTGIAIAEALKTYEIEAKLKWPNDILVNGKKICGILCEFIDSTESGEMMAVVGIGLNVNMTITESQSIDKPCTSLSILLEKNLDLEEILNHILFNLSNNIEIWQEKGFKHFRGLWISHCSHLHQTIEVQEDEITLLKGKFVGISEKGLMQIRTDDGQTHDVFSGDILWNPQNTI